jgi:hypothetical protein
MEIAAWGKTTASTLDNIAWFWNVWRNRGASHTPLNIWGGSRIAVDYLAGEGAFAASGTVIL